MDDLLGRARRAKRHDELVQRGGGWRARRKERLAALRDDVRNSPARRKCINPRLKRHLALIEAAGVELAHESGCTGRGLLAEGAPLRGGSSSILDAERVGERGRKHFVRH